MIFGFVKKFTLTWREGANMTWPKIAITKKCTALQQNLIFGLLWISLSPYSYKLYKYIYIFFFGGGALTTIQTNHDEVWGEIRPVLRKKDLTCKIEFVNSFPVGICQILLQQQHQLKGTVSKKLILTQNRALIAYYIFFSWVIVTSTRVVKGLKRTI